MKVHSLWLESGNHACQVENASFPVGVHLRRCRWADGGHAGECLVPSVCCPFLCISQLTVLPLSPQLWTPPTPPQDDNDIYIDSVMCLMYETTPIPESKLPPVYVRRERRRHKTDPSGAHPLAVPTRPDAVPTGSEGLPDGSPLSRESRRGLVCPGAPELPVTGLLGAPLDPSPGCPGDCGLGHLSVQLPAGRRSSGTGRRSSPRGPCSTVLPRAC